MGRSRKYYLDQNPLFGELPLELSRNIEAINPWWKNREAKKTPSFRRWPFDRTLRMLKKGMTPATVLKGPRRVGKTVLLRQTIQALLEEGVEANRIIYVPFDDLPTLRGIQEPILAISRWFESRILRDTFNQVANRGRPAYLLFDEVQNLDDWAPQLKNLVDNHGVRALVTGSSSLRIESGRDSLAGRVATLEMGPLLLREIAELRFHESTSSLWDSNGLDQLLSMDFWRRAVKCGSSENEIRLRAFLAFSERGGYPEAQQEHDKPWHELADYLNETIIRRAIQHDLRTGPRGQKRDERLLEEVFRLCCRYAGQAAGQSAFVPEIKETLAANIGWNRVHSYLRFLDGTLLVRLVRPQELRLKKRRAPGKICLSDHALRASWLQEVIPLDVNALLSNPHLYDLAGHLAESTLGYFLASIPNLEVAYFPTRGTEPEVDFVLTVGTKHIPIEVKYRRRIDPLDDTRGLRAYLEKTVYNAPFAILVTLDDDVRIPDPRIIPISLSSFLWIR
ncbi:MAG: ATP-binding protein [Deltaproteobacteria bacterium]|nr:ATP-binding protein [Deltaproteobacteria bacterium]